MPVNRLKKSSRSPRSTAGSHVQSQAATGSTRKSLRLAQRSGPAVARHMLHIPQGSTLTASVATSHAPSNPRILLLLGIPGFPENVEDAANLMAIARAHREKHNCRKVGAQYALQESMVQLQVLQRKGVHGRTIEQEQASVQQIREQISEAVQSVSAAEEDVGMLRGLVTRNGFPADFGPQFSSQRPYQRHHVDDEHDYNGADGLAAISDLDDECSSG